MTSLKMVEQNLLVVAVVWAICGLFWAGKWLYTKWMEN